MTAPYLGGFRVLSIAWIGINAVQLAFQAAEYSDKLFQLYAGRRLIGCTERVTDRTVSGAVPAGSAAPLSLIVIDPVDRLTDYGHLLGWIPNNLYCVSWQAPATIGDLDHFDIVMSTAAGEAYDSDNVIARVDFDAAITTYELQLPPIVATGDWEVAVIPRDNALPLGNAGTADLVTISAVVYPADLNLNTAGHRFAVDVEAGELTASFDYGS